MIGQVIPCTKNFTREILLGILEAKKVSKMECGESSRVEITFSALNVHPYLSRSASTSGDYASNKKSKFGEDRRIEEGIYLLVRRELDGKIISKCWTFNEFGHYASKCPKREKMYKKNFKSRRPIDCLYANEDDELDERVKSESVNKLGL